ncbi:Nucleotide-binding universal stress protein, UspA family [Geodermatophilus pulveris]|uniref:Nucleotide-binding universal stress protein, UspA family n=1 Tax=Geodermatophilus pulveris TaxID=1564159 RepID=A0A239F389_9ACTN|nr:universal stress protein [Geodermatophilus pulveris]SNS50743.1 Nucleotide-binding universal stress protein, UspA family [Geodermatophilus pulveris]
MTAPDSGARRLRVLVGYDGSPSSVNAIEAAATLLPSVTATILHLWEPPFTSPELRHRVFDRAANPEALGRLIESEGRAEAERLTGNGAKLARAGGWEAEPLVKRTFGGDGYQFARTAEELDADLVVVGSRGLGGMRASIGSVSELVVPASPVPVLVVPYPMTTLEWAAAESGPVVVGTDGSPPAQRALAAATELFPHRRRLLLAVEEPGVSPAPSAVEGTESVTVPCTGRAGRPRATATTLADEATRRRAAVLVVGSRGRGGAREALVGHVARALLHCAHRPVLVVPSRAG